MYKNVWKQAGDELCQIPLRAIAYIPPFLENEQFFLCEHARLLKTAE